MEVQLQPHHHIWKVSGVETHNVLGDTGRSVTAVNQHNRLSLMSGNQIGVNNWPTWDQKKQQKNKKWTDEPSIEYKIFSCTYSSPQRTAFSTPTAAVVCRSKPWPMWSAWALVLSSNSSSLGSLALGRYCRFFISLVDLNNTRFMVYSRPVRAPS